VQRRISRGERTGETPAAPAGTGGQKVST